MKRTRYEDDDAFDENGLLKDGGRMRVPTFLMDGVQHAIADAFGDSSDAALSRPGPRYATGLTRDSNTPDRDEVREFSDAERSAAWRGGLVVGDIVIIAGKRFVVDRRDADGTTGLMFDRRSAEEIMEAAYSEYDAANQVAYLGDHSGADNSVRQEGDACTTQEGRKERVVRKNMALVCEPLSDDNMSLDQLVEKRRVATSDAYAEYDEFAANAWRSK